MVEASAWVDRYREVLEVARTDPHAADVRLHDLFAADINRIIWCVVGKDQNHDHLVREVLMLLLRDIAQVREPARLRSWVFRTAVNIVRGQLRRRAFSQRFFVATERSANDFVGTMSEHEARELLARVICAQPRPALRSVRPGGDGLPHGGGPGPVIGGGPRSPSEYGS